MYNSSKELAGLFIVIGVIVMGMGFLSTCVDNAISEKRKYCEDTKPLHYVSTGDLVIFNRTGEEVRVSSTYGRNTEGGIRCDGQTRSLRVTFKDGVASGWIDPSGITVQE